MDSKNQVFEIEYCVNCGKETQYKIDNRDNLMKKMLANKYDDMMGEQDV